MASAARSVLLRLSPWLALEPLDPVAHATRAAQATRDRGRRYRLFHVLRRETAGDGGCKCGADAGAGVVLTGAVRRRLDPFLSAPEQERSVARDATVARLVREGILVTPGEDEVAGFFDALDRARPGVPSLDLLEVTTRCRMTCSFCGHGRMERVRADMPLDRFRVALDRLAEAGQTRVSLYGYGEPLLHPRIVELVRLASARGIAPCLSTVPSELAPALGEALIDAGLDAINLSVDSLDPDRFRAIRGKHADLGRAIANVEAFVAANRARGSLVTTTIRMIALERNRGEEREYVRFWKRLGVDFVLVRPFVPNVEPRPGDEAPGTWQALRPCTWPWRRAVGWREGTVAACCMDWDGRLRMGSWLEQGLAAIWEGEAYRDLRARMRAGTLAEGHPCRACPLEARNLGADLARKSAAIRSVTELPVVGWEV